MRLEQFIEAIGESMEGRMSYDAKYLKDYDAERLAVLILEAVQSAVSTRRALVPVCEYVGKVVRHDLKLEADGVKNFRGGLHLLKVMHSLDLIDKVDRWDKSIKNSRAFIKIIDWDSMKELWDSITVEKSCFQKPMLEMPEDWVHGYHKNGTKMIKKSSDSILKTLSIGSHPLLFEVLNRKQRTPFKVNQRVLRVYEQLLGQGHEVFEHMNPLLTLEQQKGKKLEADEVYNTAKSIGEREFYHMYNFDFRGRIYPLTGYFHEQSSDNAKSMIELANKVPLGETGYQWLLIHAANSWGEDKLTLQGRIDFAIENLDQWTSWAIDPMADLGWTKADKAFSFLSTIIEIMKADFSGDPETYESGFLCYIDGTTNGSQHLTALAQDESIAHHVNLIPTEKPGDLYTLVANATFDQIERMVNHDLDGEYTRIRSEMIQLYNELEEIPSNNKELISAKWDQIHDYKATNKSLIKAVAPQFWLQAKVVEKKRKIAKRNVMTLGYGSETAGFSDQLKEDCPKELDELKFINSQWSWFMADLNFKNCIRELPGPAEMLNLFKTLAIRASQRDDQFSWTVPVTNFPVVQSYFDLATKQIEDTWDGVRFRPRINLPETKVMNKRRQKQAASPNVVHSFDAAHLTMTCLACDFETVTIHDSFGTTAGNMADLFEIVREEWVTFYNEDPLKQLLTEQGSMDKMPARGTLKPEAILDSEFAFS